MDKVKGVFKFAMRMEKDAQQFYSFYENKVKAPELKELFSSLAETEQKHYELVKSQYEAIGGSSVPKDISWGIGSELESKDPGILADNADLMGDTETGISDLMIIRMAFLIEGEFEEFYKSALHLVQDYEAGKVIRELAEWEHRHKEFFQKQYNHLLKKNWEDAAALIMGE